MLEITCEPVKVKLETVASEENETTQYYYVFQENDAKLRPSRRMLKQATLAERTKKSVLRVKGIAPVYKVPHLDLGKFVFPEHVQCPWSCS